MWDSVLPLCLHSSHLKRKTRRMTQNPGSSAAPTSQTQTYLTSLIQKSQAWAPRLGRFLLPLEGQGLWMMAPGLNLDLLQGEGSLASGEEWESGRPFLSTSDLPIAFTSILSSSLKKLWENSIWINKVLIHILSEKKSILSASVGLPWWLRW